jgi:glycosyltransferase involved in cell wall biosynthesis
MNIVIIETGGWGGIGHYTHCLCSALQDTGNEVILLTHAINYQLDAFKKKYKVIPTFIGDGYSSDWIRLKANLKKYPCDIIHFQSLISTRRDWIAFWLFRYFGTKPPFIFTVHNVLPHEIKFGEKFAYNLLYRAASGLIVHSRSSQKELTGRVRGIFGTPSIVIPHGHYGEISTDDTLSRRSAIELLLLEDYRYIVFFGATRPYKGVKNFLRAASEIPDWPGDLKLLIIGQPMHGVTKEELVSARKQFNLEDKVVLKLEYIPDNHIPAVFKIADLVALPYKKIDQSGILLAALGAGRPVVCTPVGAFKETVHPGIGFLAGGTSKKDLKKALIEAIQKRKNWKEMGNSARKEALSNYSWNSIAKKTLKFYQKICSGIR